MPFDHFNALAGLFERSGVYDLSEEFLKALDPPPDCHILDAGGGTGRVSAALSGRARRVTVADPSRGMLDYARRKGLESVCSPAETLPFPDETFERILMVDALHHVADQQKTAKELWRVLKKGGNVLIVEPDIRRQGVKLLALGEKLLLMRSHFLNDEQICKLFPSGEVQRTVTSRENEVLVSLKKVR